MTQSLTLKLRLQKSGGKLWGRYLPVDDLMVKKVKDLGWNRLIAKIDEAPPLHCALVPIGNGVKGITLNKPFVKKNGFLLDQELNVELNQDLSKYGMPISEEFEAVLEADPDAKDYFEHLTPGKQRNLIYFADNVKASEIRIRRALVVMNHIKSQGGKIDFKNLTQEMKEANNRERLH